MKNMLVYLSLEHKFTKEHEDLVRIQIDNSYRMGWDKADILLVTNFEFAYNGIEAIKVDDNECYPYCPLSNNTIIIPHLCDMGLIADKELYWSHDFDAFQMDKLDEVKPILNGCDVGLTTYGWSDRWCMGSFFFKKTAKDVFEWVKTEAYKTRRTDEKAVAALTQRNYNNINDRYKILNITYNLGKRHIKYNYSIADKPLKVVHFHPHRDNLLDKFKPLITDGLVEVFKHHGVC